MAIVCLVAQLFALVHFGVAHHVRCAEHGELIELPAGANAPAHLAATSTPAHAAATLRSSQLRAEDHHDHCMVSADRRCLATADLAVAALPQPLAALAPPRTCAPAVQRPLYRLAPKISPPLA
jgi:hypothetical protein